MDIDGLIEQFRTLYKVTEDQVSDETLTAYIEKAARKLSQYYPDLLSNYVTTVAGQSVYSIEDENLLKVKNVYYSATSDEYQETTDESVAPNAPKSTFFLTSQLEQIEKQKMQDLMNPYDAEIKSFNKFTLIPTPAISGNKVYYEYETYRTIEDIPDLFEEDIIGLVFYYIGEVKIQEQMADPNSTKYNFDRKGNIIADKTNTVEAVKRVHKENLNDVIKNIQNKIRAL